MKPTPAHYRVKLVAVLAAAMTVATNAQAAASTSGASNPTDACLGGSADACDVAAAAADADHPALAAHLREEAARLRRTPGADAASAGDQRPCPIGSRFVLGKEGCRAPEAPLPAKPASAPGFSAGRVGLQALAGVGVLGASLGLGLVLGQAPCGGLFCEAVPVFTVSLVGLTVLPFVSYAVGAALGGRGTLAGALLGALASWLVAGLVLGSVLSGGATAPVGGGTNPLLVGGLTVATLAVVLGPALGTEFFPEASALTFTPVKGGGVLVFAHRF